MSALELHCCVYLHREFANPPPNYVTYIALVIFVYTLEHSEYVSPILNSVVRTGFEPAYGSYVYLNYIATYSTPFNYSVRLPFRHLTIIQIYN